MTFSGLVALGLVAALALLVMRARQISRRDIGSVYDRLLKGDAQDALAELAAALRAQETSAVNVLPPHAPTPASARD